MIWKILKGARKKRVPLSTVEIVRRGVHSSEILEWTRGKRITIFNPPFWGIHHAFIDSNLTHAIICLKADRSTYVFLGNSAGAHSWAKYDQDQKLIEEDILKEDQLKWNFYEDYVIYRGSLLPPTRDPYHWGKVVDLNPFEDNISPEWIVEEIRLLLTGFSE